LRLEVARAIIKEFRRKYRRLDSLYSEESLRSFERNSVKSSVRVSRGDLRCSKI
jgi:hypothetical protein